ncbi:MAG: insulinase family protein [Verrucomicrobia bacterium]|nr:insulinase family protein [Verrucomicrobiota bacterium]
MGATSLVLTLCLVLLFGCIGPRSEGGADQRAVTATGGTDWSKVVDPRTLEFEPLEFEVPAVERVVLANGMVVYLMEDHMLPLVKVYAVAKTGSIHEPAEKAGLASLTGDVMRTGGTEAMTPDELNEALEFMAAEIGIGIEREAGRATLDVLKKDLDEGLRLYADVLRRPRFDERMIALRKAELGEEFRRENDQPEEVLFREFREALYGTHPYARRVTGYPETVARITRDDLVAFHKQFFHPNNLIMGVSGDFERDEMLAKLEAVFGDWPKADLDIPEPPAVPTTFTRSLKLVDKDLVQSNIVLGHLGIDRLDPDYYAAYVLNDILGGSGFNSRLTEQVRTKAGLAYSVGSYFHAPRYTGFFFAYCFTKTETTSETVQMILDELERVRREPVTDEEFERARRSIENQFVFRFQTAEQIVAQKAELEYIGLPSDYLERYLDTIRGVTKEDLMRVAQRLIQPDRITLLIVGKPEALDGFPEGFGTFEPIDLDQTPVSGLVGIVPTPADEEPGDRPIAPESE